MNKCKQNRVTGTLSSKYLEGRSSVSRQNALVKSTFFDSKIATVMRNEKSSHKIPKSSSPNATVKSGKLSKHQRGQMISGISASSWAACVGRFSSSDESECSSSSDEETSVLSSNGRGQFRKQSAARTNDSSASYGDWTNEKPISTKSFSTKDNSSKNTKVIKHNLDRGKLLTRTNEITDYSSESGGDNHISSDEDDNEHTQYVQYKNSSSRSTTSSSMKHGSVNHILVSQKLSQSKENILPTGVSARDYREVSEAEVSVLTSSIFSHTSERFVASRIKQHINSPVSPNISKIIRQGKLQMSESSTLITESKPTTPVNNPSPGSSMTTLKRDLASKKEIIEMLKSQLLSKGVEPVTEIVSYEKAQQRLKGALEILMSGDDSAEVEFNKWDEYVRNHPEFKAKEEQEKVNWKMSNELLNSICYDMIRSIVPADVYQTTLSRLEQDLPLSVAKRVWARKVLWLTRMTPLNISRLHVADLQTKYSVQGLDEVELRAVWHALPEKFDNDPSKVKANWKDAILVSLRSKKSVSGEEALSQEKCEIFISTIQRHVAYKEQQNAVTERLWRGPYDPDSEFVNHAVGASHVDTAPSRPIVNKLTPSRSKKLATTGHKVISSQRKNGNGELQTIPESDSSVADNDSVTETTCSSKTAMMESSKSRKGSGEPVGGAGIRSIMEEILMKGLLKNKQQTS